METVKRTNVYLKIHFYQTDSTEYIPYNTQASNKSIKIICFRSIPVRSAMAYVNQFLTLPTLCLPTESIFIEEGNIGIVRLL
jgi:hypothetical protein